MSHDMKKCPNCENCITNLRQDVKRLEAENAHLRVRAEKEEALAAERDVLASHIVNHAPCDRCPLQGHPHKCHEGRENMRCIEFVIEWAAQEATKR